MWVLAGMILPDKKKTAPVSGSPLALAENPQLSRSAGRYTSNETIRGLLPILSSQRAGFAVEVVLPEPLRRVPFPDSAVTGVPKDD